jgi:hypothetical protein
MFYSGCAVLYNYQDEPDFNKNKNNLAVPPVSAGQALHLPGVCLSPNRHMPLGVGLSAIRLKGLSYNS